MSVQQGHSRRSWMARSCLVVAIASLVASANAAEADANALNERNINIVLVGATGSLAKKYLVQALFDTHTNAPPNIHLSILAAARSGEDVITESLSDTVSGLHCTCVDPSDCTPLDQDACERAKARFKETIRVAQLKTEDDYKSMCQTLSTDGETQRIFYLSIPPFSYSTVAQWINTHCRPGPDAQLQVALEKPFGSDVHTANNLEENLHAQLDEGEIYRVDHYLGKAGVHMIQEFKEANTQLFNKLVQSNMLDRVDIFMTETEDCKGRTKFYDHYGVIRDVMQNHLMEILAIVAMEVPRTSSSQEHYQRKNEVFNQLKPISVGNVVTGQYEQYISHLRSDFSDAAKSSTTPTFAAAVAYIDSKRWKTVPFLLVSGKQLRRRRAHVDLHFRRSAETVCLHEECEARIITFNIQGAPLERPGVIVTGKFSDLVIPEGWTTEGSQTIGRLVLYPPAKPSNAYSAVMMELIQQRREFFVSNLALMASWRAWMPVLSAEDRLRPRLYSEGGEQVRVHFGPSHKLTFLSDHNKGRARGSKKPQAHTEL